MQQDTNPEFLPRIYRSLRLIRRVEEEIARIYPSDKIKSPVHLSIGQEAISVGVCDVLRHDDAVSPTYRGHATFLAKGGPVKGLMAELYGKETGVAGGKGGSMHLIDLSVNMLGCTPIVGGSLPVAVGVAFAAAQQKRDSVTAVFFGEAATEEGVFFESVNFAALRKLPIVFVCENNGYSVYSPMSVRQPASRDRLAMTRGNGCQAASCHGNDVDEVYALAAHAVEDARRGGGPWFLEFETYRWREHCGPAFDNTIGYRAEEEFKQWQARCPVETFKTRLLERGDVVPADITRLERDIAEEIESAFAYAKAAPFPDARHLLSNLFVEGPRA